MNAWLLLGVAALPYAADALALIAADRKDARAKHNAERDAQRKHATDLALIAARGGAE